MRTGAVVQKETGEDIVIDLGECDIVQVEPDDEVSTALAVCGDRFGHISLCHGRLKERLHHAAAAPDLRRHPHASRLHEEAEKPVQMPSAAFGVLAVTARTGTGTVVVPCLRALMMRNRRARCPCARGPPKPQQSPSPSLPAPSRHADLLPRIATGGYRSSRRWPDNDFWMFLPTLAKPLGNPRGKLDRQETSIWPPNHERCWPSLRCPNW